MVQRRCAAKTCFNTTNGSPNIKFFTFPQTDFSIRAWADACGRPELIKKSKESLKRYVLCAEHFEDYWFVDPETKTTFVKTYVPIPTLFKNNLKEYVKRHTNLTETNKSPKDNIVNDVPLIEHLVSQKVTQKKVKSSDKGCSSFDIDKAFKDSIDNPSSTLMKPYKNDSTSSNMERSCRLCANLFAAKSLSSIYDDNLEEKLNMILPLQFEVYEDDGLPKEICFECVRKVTLCYNIIHQFLSAYDKLRKPSADYEQSNDILIPTFSSPTALLVSESKCMQNGFYGDELDEEKNSILVETRNCPDNNESDLDDTGGMKNDCRVTSSVVFQPVKQNDSISESTNSSTYLVDLDGNVVKETFVSNLSTCIDLNMGKTQETIFLKKNCSKRKIIKKYKCSDCTSDFITRKAYRTHLKWHMPGSYMCKYCGKCFLSECSLVTHKKLHVHETPRQCNICGELFIFANSFRRHKKIHINDNCLKMCNTCDKVFASDEKLKTHEKKHHQPHSVLCTLCGKTLASLQGLKIHLTTHTGERSFSCRICSKTFKTKSQLCRHNDTHRKDRIFECAHCPKKFHVKALLRQHMCSHSGMKPYVCDICGASYNRRGNLGQHRKAHFDLQNGKPLANEEVIRCNICRKKVKSLLLLQYHIAKHNGEKKAYKCSICDKRFSTGAQLKVHDLQHTGERPHICIVCNKGFRTEATMKQHYLSLHTDEYPHQCPFCDRKFKRLQSLIVHKRTHTGERPYPCPICGRAFAQKGDMMKHTNIHTQDNRKYARKRANNIENKTTTEQMTILTVHDSRVPNEYFIRVSDIELT